LTNAEDAERAVSDAGFVLAPPDRLYTPAALYDGFDPDDDLSIGRSLDYRTYLATLAQGMPIARSAGIVNTRALHDAAITYSLAARVVDTHSVGILGGHGEPRGSQTYNTVARIAYELTQKGYTILTGGGPGAMEAAHLGARYANLGQRVFDDALARISAPAISRFPFRHSSELVVDGGFDPASMRALHAWLAPAIGLARESEGNAAPSIGIPTWAYGHEPSTPFATEHAKYFENSIREDGLLALALYGAVYAPGSAGTLQEIFEDANQNFYVPPNEGPSPMVFLDIEGWWTTRYPVIPVLRTLFGDRFDEIVAVVTTARDAVAAIAERSAAVAGWADTAANRKLRA
jgi:predicted Rossmann-fold nucleotide-binding protein